MSLCLFIMFWQIVKLFDKQFIGFFFCLCLFTMFDHLWNCFIKFVMNFYFIYILCILLQLGFLEVQYAKFCCNYNGEERDGDRD